MPRPDIYCRWSRISRFTRRENDGKVENRHRRLSGNQFSFFFFFREFPSSNSMDSFFTETMSTQIHQPNTSKWRPISPNWSSYNFSWAWESTYLKRIRIGHLPPCPFQAVASFHLSEKPLVFRLPSDGCQRCQTKFDRMERKARRDHSMWTLLVFFSFSSRFEQLYNRSQRKPEHASLNSAKLINNNKLLTHSLTRIQQFHLSV